MTNPNCDISFLQDVQRKIETSDYKPERKQELLNHVDDLMRKVNALGTRNEVRTLSGTAQEVQERLTQQLAMAQANQLSPKLARNFGHYLAFLFDVKRSMLGLSDELSPPGVVRELIQSFEQRGFGEIRELIASLNLQDLSISADQTFRQVQRKYNIPQKPFELFKIQMAELPHHPYIQETFNLTTPAGIEMLRGRQQFVKDIAQRYGISSADMDALAEVTKRVTDTYMEIRQVIDVFGIRMGDANVDNIQRYVPRQFSQEAINRIYKHKDSDPTGVFRNMFDGQPKTVREMFVQARHTNHFSPESEALVDFVLRQADPTIYDKLSKATKLNIAGIEDVIADNGMFVRAFTDYFDKTPKTAKLFDDMVDAGLIDMLPMSGSELYDYVMTRYNLPFNTPKEMFNVSFETQTEIYRRQLETLAGRAMAAQFVGRSAVEGEWGVSRAVVDADPVTYKNFRPLVGVRRGESGNLEPSAGAIPGDFALRFGMVGPEYENVYVHPVVADNISALLEIGTSPNKLGVIARTFDRINTVFKSQALATSGFVFRQFLNNLIQTTASGGALNVYAHDVVRVLGKVSELGFNHRSIDNLVELFDDKARIYDGMTERELWVRLQREGFLEQIMPLAAANFNNINYKPDFAPVRAIDNQWRYMRDVWSRTESVSDVERAMRESVGQTSRAVDNLSSRFFYRFQQMGSLFDQVARLSAMKSLIASPVSSKGTPTMSVSQRLRAAYEGPVSRGALGNFRNPRSYDEALIHAKKYFFNFSDLGEADKVINRYVVPFWSFTSRNTFSVFKKMVREPHTFVAYQRIYAALQEPVVEEGEDWPAAGEPDWLTDTQPLRFITEDGDYFALPLTPLDPFAEGISKVSELGDSFLDAIGIDLGADSPEAELDRLINRRTNRGLENIISESYPWYKSAYAFISGNNPDKHREFKRSAEVGGNESSFLGFRTSPFWRWQFEQWSPMLSRLNRQNPNGVFGRPPRFDSETGELIDAPTPAWLTGVPRDKRDVVRDYQSWRRRAASYLGVSFTPVNTIFSMGYNEAGLSIAMRDAANNIKKQRAHIAQLTLPTDIERETTELYKMYELYSLLRIDLADVTAWAEERDIPVSRAIRRIQADQLNQLQIQTLTEEERFDLLQDSYDGVNFFEEQ